MSYEIMQLLMERVDQDHDFRQQIRMAPEPTLSEYDLTEEEKQQLILPNFSWLIEHKLAGVSQPWSEDALTILKTQGVNALLSLTEEPISPELLSKVAMQAEHLPIADYTAPTITQVDQAIVTINSYLNKGFPVAVHCAAGLGRTGTILACYLVWQGASAEAAVIRVRTQRPGSIETSEQEAVVNQYEHYKANL
jgi:atypical dual specificity phosphatase